MVYFNTSIIIPIYVHLIPQDVYVACKDAVLEKMHKSLSRILSLPEEQESDEELYDICRAYGLLLNVCGKSQCHEHKASSKKVLITWHLL